MPSGMTRGMMKFFLKAKPSLSASQGLSSHLCLPCSKHPSYRVSASWTYGSRRCSPGTIENLTNPPPWLFFAHRMGTVCPRFHSTLGVFWSSWRAGLKKGPGHPWQLSPRHAPGWYGSGWSSTVCALDSPTILKIKMDPNTIRNEAEKEILKEWKAISGLFSMVAIDVGNQLSWRWVVSCRCVVASPGQMKDLVKYLRT